MRKIPNIAMAALVAAALMLTLSPRQADAHIQNECMGNFWKMEKRVKLISGSLEEFQQLPENLSAKYVPKLQHVIRLSIDALNAATDGVVCVTSRENVEESSAHQDMDSDHEAAMARELCFVEAHLEKRSRDAIAEAEFRVEIAGLGPTEQSFRRRLREQKVAVEDVRQRHEIAKKCR